MPRARVVARHLYVVVVMVDGKDSLEQGIHTVSSDGDSCPAGLHPSIVSRQSISSHPRNTLVDLMF